CCSRERYRFQGNRIFRAWSQPASAGETKTHKIGFFGSRSSNWQYPSVHRHPARTGGVSMPIWICMTLGLFLASVALVLSDNLALSAILGGTAFIAPLAVARW